MGTSLEILVNAMKGGETRIDMLIQMAYELPAPIGAKFVEELKGLKDLFGAVERGIESVE
jgi:Flp pilus assembly protein TadB